MLNSIVIQGRLTNDPELKYTNSGKSVTSFSIACERDFSTNGEKETDFINIVAWNGTAEFISKFFQKGKQILLKGSLQTRKYQTKNGENRTVTEVIADKVYFCGDKVKDPLEELNGKLDDTNQSIDDFTEVDSDDDLPF